MQKIGKEIQVGDMLDLWLGKVRVMTKTPYVGPNAHLWAWGAFIATFDNGRKLTMSNSARYDVIEAAPPPMTPDRVIATGKQFGQKIGKAEAKRISALLVGWRGAKA